MDAQNPGAPMSGEEYSRLSDAVIVHGSVALALAMAQETGIAEVLCKADSPLTSNGIAQRAGLKERYVREVLHALVASRFLQQCPSTGEGDRETTLFVLQDKYRALLHKAAVTSLHLSCAARLFQPVKQCFSLNEPSSVRYDATFFELMDSRRALDVNDVMEAVLKTPHLREKLESGMEVAEVGCGSGRLLLRLAAMFPRSRFTLTDAVPGALERAKTAAADAGVANVTFDTIDACKPPESWMERFDWLVAQDVIHDLPYPQRALNGIFQSLRKGGHLSLIEGFLSSHLQKNIGNSEAAMRYSFSIFFCIPESYQQPDSEALGGCMGEEKARALLQEAGFQVLGITKCPNLGSLGVCMCQKPTEV